MTRISTLLSVVLAAGPAAAHPSAVNHVHLADGTAHASSGWGLMLVVIALALCGVFALTKAPKS